jgi:myo-inositol-1(or 4)-monophosphatase
VYEREREIALAAAREANHSVRTLHGQGASATSKGGHPLNLVTEVDVAVEQGILRRLREAFPADGFLAEESGEQPPREGSPEGRATPRRWVIDPICGTRNFTYRLPSVATNIALLQRVPRPGGGSIERAVLGVVAISPGGDLLWAVAGEGAYARMADGSDTRLQVSAASHMVNVDYGYALISGKSSYIAAIAALLVRSATVPLRNIGSSASLAYQALGSLAGNLFQQSKPWDVTAGCLLCQEAGALVTDFTGRPWDPFGDTFLVASDQQTYDLIREAIDAAPALQPALDAWQRARAGRAVP